MSHPRGELTEQWSSRWRFIEIIAVLIGVDFFLIVLAVLISFSLSPTVMVLALSLLGPVWCLILFSPSVSQASYLLFSCLMFFAYIIKPTQFTFGVSIFGAIVWILSGFFVLLSQQ
jgi:hypothetical protein